jgi:hypothetical protein
MPTLQTLKGTMVVNATACLGILSGGSLFLSRGPLQCIFLGYLDFTYLCCWLLGAQYECGAQQVELRLQLWQAGREWDELLAIWTATAFSVLDIASMEAKVAAFHRLTARLEAGLPPNKVCVCVRVCVCVCVHMGVHVRVCVCVCMQSHMPSLSAQPLRVRSLNHRPSSH